MGDRTSLNSFFVRQFVPDAGGKWSHAPHWCPNKEKKGVFCPFTVPRSNPLFHCVPIPLSSTEKLRYCLQ